jgi:PAS domain S-box-containing protein
MDCAVEPFERVNSRKTTFVVLCLGTYVLASVFAALAIRAVEAHRLHFGVAVSILIVGFIPLFSILLWWCLAALSAREKAARRNEERLASMAAVVESSDDAIITKDLNGTITSWNAGAQRIFGYTATEVIGKPITILIPPDREDEEPNILSRLRRGERIDHYETIRRCKDGTLLDISLTVSPVRDSQGRVIGASKIARDITEVRRGRAALERSHEELEKHVAERTASLRQAIAQMEEFSYSVSHDLRAPVRAMRGYAEVILEDYGEALDATAREYVRRILNGSSRMEQLIHDVLTYTRLARSEVMLKPTSLQKLVTEVIEQYPQMQPPAAEIEIRQPLQDVLAHEASLTQAVSNLLSNGVKFVAPGTKPKLQLWTEAHNGTVRLWIKDNGIGINPKYHHRLFGMFERVHESSSYQGTGIGLAIVRKAADKMGGRVGVESEGAGGSNFWIELAAAKKNHD